MPRKIEISHRTILFTFILTGLVWLLFLIKDLILELTMAVLITVIFDPMVTKLSGKGVPRPLSVVFIYVVTIGALALSIASFFPSLIEQTSSFILNFPNFLGRIGVDSLISEQIRDQAISQLSAVPAQIASTTVSLFSNVIGIISVLVFAFYLLSEKDKLYYQLTSWFPEDKRKDINNSIYLIEQKIGDWFRAEMILMVVIGTATYVGLKLLGVPFALPLAIIAGLLELIPYLGPIIAAIPAVFIGFGISPFMGLAVTALSFLIQQLENYVLVPKVMQRSIGVNPIVTLICIAIGARLAGIVGVIISVPLYISLAILFRKYLVQDEVDQTS